MLKNSMFIQWLWHLGDNEPLSWTICQLESAADDCMKDYSPFSPQRSDASTPGSVYMESCEFSDFLFAVLKIFTVML